MTKVFTDKKRLIFIFFEFKNVSRGRTGECKRWRNLWIGLQRSIVGFLLYSFARYYHEFAGFAPFDWFPQITNYWLENPIFFTWSQAASSFSSARSSVRKINCNYKWKWMEFEPKDGRKFWRFRRARGRTNRLPSLLHIDRLIPAVIISWDRSPL